MDSVTEFEAESLVGPEVAPKDRAELKRDRERLRLRRKLANVKKRAHAQGMMDGILSQLKQGDIALDCGANVGTVTKRLAETGATVYAFEPDPVAFAELTKRCEDYPNVCLINAAVGTSAGTATLHRSPLFTADPVKATVSSTLVEGVRPAEAGEDENSVEVEVVDLPNILIDLLAGRDPKGTPERLGVFRRPDSLAFLKLDIEGAELDLMNALHKADLLSQIRSTVVETHERKFPGLRRGFKQLRQEMASAYAPSKVFLDWI